MANRVVFSDSLSHLSGAFLPALSAAGNHLFAYASRNVVPDFLTPYYCYFNRLNSNGKIIPL
jgi:hypothetical protein